jgi:urease gamma subunit
MYIEKLVDKIETRVPKGVKLEHTPIVSIINKAVLEALNDYELNENTVISCLINQINIVVEPS